MRATARASIPYTRTASARGTPQQTHCGPGLPGAAEGWQVRVCRASSWARPKVLEGQRGQRTRVGWGEVDAMARSAVVVVEEVDADAGP